MLASVVSQQVRAQHLESAFHLCSHTDMREELPFVIIRESDVEVLARVTTLMLAQELFRVIANIYFPDQILLKEETRVIKTSAERRSGG
jgi:hypothetical protein